MPDSPEYFRIERPLSQESTDAIELFVHGIFAGCPAARREFRPDLKRLHTSTLNAEEFGYTVRNATPDAIIHKLPPAAWKAALQKGMDRWDQQTRSLESVRTSITVIGNHVALLLHSEQLQEERAHAVSMMQRLGGSCFATDPIHLSIGMRNSGQASEFFQRAGNTPLPKLEFSPIEVHGVPRENIDRRLDIRPPKSVLSTATV